MRYIRDIIREKEAGTASTVAPAHDDGAAPDSEQPLLLEEPIFPDAVDRGPAVALEQLAATRSAGQHPDVEATAEASMKKVMPRAVKPTEQDPTPLRIRDRAERLAKAAALAEDSSANSDPFDRLREPAALSREGNQPVSPLRAPQSERSMQSKHTHPASPLPVDGQSASGSVPEEGLTPLANALTPESVKMPAPAAGRGSKVSGRVKTRLLGFSSETLDQDDPFKSKSALSIDFPVGWLVVISEKGRGKSFALSDGVSSVGRGEDQTVCLDIGDNSISRENHISIAFDAERKKFFVGHGGKTNLVRLNNTPLLSTEELKSTDQLRLGETTLRFVALCDETFSWNDTVEQDANRA